MFCIGSFFATANETQPWDDEVNTRIVFVFTAKSCANDCIWGYGKVAGDPKSYSEDSLLYVMYQYNYSFH